MNFLIKCGIFFKYIFYNMEYYIKTLNTLATNYEDPYVRDFFFVIKLTIIKDSIILQCANNLYWNLF